MQNISYNISKAILTLLLIVSPILLGSNRHVFELINLALAILALSFFIFSGNMGKLLRGLNSKARNILIFMFLVIPLWLAVQASTLTPESLHHPLWAQLNLATSGAISINPGLTWASLISYMSLSVVFIGIYMAVCDLKSAKKMQFTCLMVINAIAVFGLITYLFDFQTLGIVDKTEYRNWLTATFVYKNAMSNFVGFGIIICVAYLVELQLNKRVLTQKISHSTQIFLMTINLVILLAVQILTGSRGGIGSVLCAAIIMLVLVVYSKNRGEKRRQKPTLSFYIIALIVIFIAAIAFYYLAENRGGDAAIGSTHARLAQIGDAISAIFDRPWLGHGAGTYIDIEPLYHQLNMQDNILWNKLHSTHLELLLGLGLPVFIAIYYFVFATLARQINRAIKSSVNWRLTLPAIGIVIQTLAHASVDFTLQIPTISLYGFLLVSLSFNQRFRFGKKTNINL